VFYGSSWQLKQTLCDAVIEKSIKYTSLARETRYATVSFLFRQSQKEFVDYLYGFIAIEIGFSDELSEANKQKQDKRRFPATIQIMFQSNRSRKNQIHLKNNYHNDLVISFN
jgi:hypothetical protein